MNWKTILALPALGLAIWIVIAAMSFGDRIASTWTEGTTTTVTNGLVMVCFGAAFFGVFLISIVIGVALASRLLAQPVRQPSEPRPSFGDGLRSKITPAGWGDEPVVDSYGERGRVVAVESPVPGLRPMLPGQAMGSIVPLGSGVFDGMEEAPDRRYRTGS